METGSLYTLSCADLPMPPIALYVNLIKPWLPSTYFSGLVPWFTIEILGGRLDFMSPLQERNFSNTGTLRNLQYLWLPAQDQAKHNSSMDGGGGGYSRGPEVLLIIVS